MLALIWIFSSLANAMDIDPKTCAENTATQFELNMCARAQWEVADAELNRIYPEVRFKLDKIGQAKLRDAQRTWIAFRDAQCAWESDSLRGGSGEPMEDWICKTRLTEERVAVLKKALPENQ